MNAGSPPGGGGGSPSCARRWFRPGRNASPPPGGGGGSPCFRRDLRLRRADFGPPAQARGGDPPAQARGGDKPARAPGGDPPAQARGGVGGRRAGIGVRGGIAGALRPPAEASASDWAAVRTTSAWSASIQISQRPDGDDAVGQEPVRPAAAELRLAQVRDAAEDGRDPAPGPADRVLDLREGSGVVRRGSQAAEQLAHERATAVMEPGDLVRLGHRVVRSVLRLCRGRLPDGASPPPSQRHAETERSPSSAPSTGSASGSATAAMFRRASASSSGSPWRRS